LDLVEIGGETMDNQNCLASHEILELRELMDINLIGAKKIKASMPMVKDAHLKSYMQKCLNSKKENINCMQDFVEKNLSM
jgi:hypothetical protein